ncbi:MAG: phospholipase D-like domain-containing protein, partial [Pseudomonadales bacterium]
MQLFARRSSLISFLFILAVVSGCASVPFDYPKQESQVTRISDATKLGRNGLEWAEEHGSQSGFIPLTGGNDALGVRLKMMEGAEESIDAQYFLLKPDQAGMLFVGGLLEAADRGVRVRFLLDDIFTPGVDSQLTILNSHPNIEVRLFNPMTRQSFKYWSLLVDFGRANRRMHNKVFVADDALAVLGGRNIAEEYFEIEPDVEFADFDVLAVGPVVSDAADTFDEFWNSAAAVPVEAFEVDIDPAQLDVWREKMKDIVSGEQESVYFRALSSRLLADIIEERAPLFIGEAHVVTDAP